MLKWIIRAAGLLKGGGGWIMGILGFRLLKSRMIYLVGAAWIASLGGAFWFAWDMRGKLVDVDVANRAIDTIIEESNKRTAARKRARDVIVAFERERAERGEKAAEISRHALEALQNASADCRSCDLGPEFLRQLNAAEARTQD